MAEFDFVRIIYILTHQVDLDQTWQNLSPLQKQYWYNIYLIAHQAIVNWSLL